MSKLYEVSRDSSNLQQNWQLCDKHTSDDSCQMEEKYKAIYHRELGIRQIRGLL